MKHLFYYTLKLDGCSPIHFETMSLLERSLEISFHRDLKGKVRLKQLTPIHDRATHEVMQGEDTERVYPTGDRSYSTTTYSGGTPIGRVYQTSIMVNDEVTHV